MLVAAVLWVLLVAAVVYVNAFGEWNRAASTLLVLAAAAGIYVTATAAF